MFAMLGVIPFEVVGSPEGYDSAEGFDYKEDKVLDAKPQIQWVGDDLRRISFDLVFHASFTNPALQLAALRTAASLHGAYPLVFAAGTYVGMFVIESLKVKAQVMTDLGGLVSIKVALALKEWIAPVGISPLATLLGITAAAIATSPRLGIAAAALPAGASALRSNANAGVAAAAEIAPSLEAFDVPLATVVRAPAAFAKTNPTAFTPPTDSTTGSLAEAVQALVGVPR